MIEQIKGQLDAYLTANKVNLSKNRKDSIIEKLTKRVETEEEIEKAIEDYSDFIVEIAKADDRARTLEAKKPIEEPAQTQTTVEVEQPKEDATIELLKALQAEIQGLKTEKMQETLFDKFKKDERNKNIPSALLETLAPQTAEDYESAVERINSIAVEFNKTSLPNTTPPTSKGDPKQATDQEIKNLAKDIC